MAKFFVLLIFSHLLLSTGAHAQEEDYTAPSVVTPIEGDPAAGGTMVMPSDGDFEPAQAPADWDEGGEEESMDSGDDF